jgi:hypothetical protein
VVQIARIRVARVCDQTPGFTFFIGGNAKVTAEDWKFVIQVFGSLGIGAAASGAVIHLFLKTFASSYLAEKGKNLATKEDIQQITRAMEEVKSELQARHTLRFAALDKRLQTHQEAYAHISGLIKFLHKPDGEELRQRLTHCQEWFDSNGLYLEPLARNAFWSAWGAGQMYYSLDRATNYNPKQLKQNWDLIMTALSVIQESVGLPPLNDDIATGLSNGAPEVGRDAR